VLGFRVELGRSGALMPRQELRLLCGK
jgi:hypothetical protein